MVARSKLVLGLLLIPACIGSSDTETFTNSGTLCFQSLDDGRVAVVVRFPTCLSSSCDEATLAECQVVEDDGTIRVESRAEVEREGGECTDDCGSLTASCTSEPLAPGSYSVKYGSDSASLSLPAEDAILFSDGSDRYSQHSAADVVERARRSNALIYPIAIGKNRPALLAELAVLTGGRSFLLRDPRDLQATLSTIARELRNQYLIGYTPVDPIVRGEREWRSIRVTLANPRPGVRVRARDGYTTE